MMAQTSDHTCPELLQHLSDYLDGAAATAVCAQIEQHLQHCPDCQIVVDTLRQTIHLYHTLPATDLPEHLRQRLYSSLDLESYLPTNS